MNLDAAYHTVSKWEDPFPKPCYLFALVAGDFDLLEDIFVTQEQREIKLQVFVDKGNLEKSKFAMASLKNAMAWDETRFNLSYDLDIYMIVAVDFFNMGAMENKGLNIFNSKYVLADPASATDQDFLNIESVIGHEYFHNWTGNRITCRDWFQLSLKEGLTVFRDQEFSADRGMREINRIQDVRIMRTHQFDEDASPMAHPIRPDQVMEMNNFYTVTVYNKGAEVIRMLHTLLGETGFQAGMQLYVSRHDGQAVTCEDFVRAMEDANQRDFSQFRRWYSQAGTPRVQIAASYVADEQKLILDFKQETPATPEQSEKFPFHIPLKAELFTHTGAFIRPTEWPQDGVIELKGQRQQLVFTGVPADFIFAPLANFSAPIRVDYASSFERLIAIVAHAKDTFLRWDAVQQIYLQILKQSIQTKESVTLAPNVVELLAQILTNYRDNLAVTALLLELPSEEAIASEFDIIPVASIHRSLRELRAQIATELKTAMLAVVAEISLSPEVFNSEAISARMLASVLNSYLALQQDENINALLETQFATTSNMTVSLGALQACVSAEHPAADLMLEQFRERWGENSLVMDKWFAVQAAIPSARARERVGALIKDPMFNWNLPNRVYALLATFSHNLAQLHHPSGEGYDVMIDAIKKLNRTNPQVASRLISPLLKWRRLEPEQGDKLKSALATLQRDEKLSNDLYEKVSKSLAEAL